MIELVAGAATDVGRVRTNNQDSFLVAHPLFAVADGMGGHAAGEVASATALNGLQAAFAEGPDAPSATGLAAAMAAANRAVWDAAEANVDYRGMGTTLTAVALIGTAPDDQALAVANVGDSRTYRLRHGELEQVTADHSLVAELVAEGQITEGQAEVHPQRHVLTRALGVAPEVEIDVVPLEAQAGDRYLLCSDGLIREVDDERVASVLRRLADPAEAARELVAEARDNGGSDNITVVVVDVRDGAEPADPTAAVPVVGSAATAEEGKRAAVEAVPPAGPEPRMSRAQRRRAARASQGPRTRAVTGRVVAFVALIVVVLVVAVAGTAWYARESYFVGVQRGQLVIYKGRPGGVLWWKPTLAASTTATDTSVEAYHLPALHAGVQESSLGAARQYVARLESEARAARPPATTPTTVTPTTVTPTTVPATTVPATTVPPTTVPATATTKAAG